MWRDLYEDTYRYMRRRGLPHADAEDIAQDVLAAAYVNIEGIDPGKLRAWLFAAARNKAVDRYRRVSRLAPLDTTSPFADASQDPEHSVHRSMAAAELRGAVKSLPERDAHLVSLHYFEERSLADIARDQGMTPAAVKIALFRARRRLRRALETREAP